MTYLNFFGNGRRPQFSKNGRRPQIFKNGRRPQIFKKVEDNLNFVLNGNQFHFWKMEAKLSFLKIGILSQFLKKWKTTSILKKQGLR